MHAAVIGGGWAGLAAAVELAAGGIRVTVFEAARQLGGRARTVEIDSLALDNGQHILVGAYTETLRLMHRIGASAHHNCARLPLSLCYPGALDLRARALPPPLHLAAALVGARGLAWRQRLAALRFMRALQACDYRVPAGETVSSLLDRLGQGGKLRALVWEALCISALNTPPEQASAQVFAHVLRDTLAGAPNASDLLLPAAGLSDLLPAPAARYVTAHGGEVRCATSIDGIAEDGEGFRLNGDAAARRYTHLVLAVAPYNLPRLARGLPQLAAAARLAGALAYEPIVTGYLRYGRPVALPQAMVGGTGCAQWFFDRHRLGGEPGLVAAVVSASRVHREMEASALADRLHSELQAIAGPLPPPVWRRIIAEKRATFACVAALRRPGRRVSERLFLAGDYVDSPYPATLESAVRSGVACARAIAAGKNDNGMEKTSP